MKIYVNQENVEQVLDPIKDGFTWIPFKGKHRVTQIYLTGLNNLVYTCALSIRNEIYYHLYGRESCFLILRKEHRLKMSENRVPRKIFGPKRNEIIRRWKLCSEKLHALYYSRNIIIIIKSRRMRWAGCVTSMGDERIQGFGGKNKRK
jgi:hypothetical protein